MGLPGGMEASELSTQEVLPEYFPHRKSSLIADKQSSCWCPHPLSRESLIQPPPLLTSCVSPSVLT